MSRRRYYRAMRIVVIGGGIAGLAAAWAARAEAARRAETIDLVVLEAGPRAGGRIRTTHEAGYLVEWAANAIQGDDGAAWRLAEAAGLANDRVHARSEAARRYVVRRGRLHLLPRSPAALLGFAGLSPMARVRVLCEPFFARRHRQDESVHDFAARHLGQEAADVLVGAAVRGVFAGDARHLSVDAAFPTLRAMERKHRSLAVALARGGRAGAPRGGGKRALWSLTGGLQSLTDALARGLGNALRLASPALAIERADPGFAIRTASGDHIHADSVILAVPARAAASLLRPLDAETSKLLTTVESAGLAVVGLAFRREAFRRAPDGYGYLVSPGEPLPVLGALFESNLFPERAPEGRVLVRVMLGGSVHPEHLTKSDAELAGLAMGALDRTHGLAIGPDRTWVIRQEAAIPQYRLGHATAMAEAEKRLAIGLPGLYLGGNACRGVSVSSLIEDAERIAIRAVRRPAGVTSGPGVAART